MDTFSYIYTYIVSYKYVCESFLKKKLVDVTDEVIKILFDKNTL